MEKRNCLRCEGLGTTFRAGFTYCDTSYPDETRVCNACKGEKQFDAPNFDVILQQITTSRGAAKNSRKLLTGFPPKLKHYSCKNAARAYYVWRLARFHGGKDTTMPMTATMVIAGDPFIDELNKYADDVAASYLGSNMKAAARWAQAFGIV